MPGSLARLVFGAALWCSVASGASAQVASAPGDTLHLDVLQDAALRHDPRGAQDTLLARQSALRLGNLRAEGLPSIDVNGRGQYQSTTLALPFTLPGGATPPAPPLDTYDAHVEARERIYDPTLGARRSLESATLAESRARVRTALFALRANVNEAWFAALKAEEQRKVVETGIADLAAQLDVARHRERAGSALPSEATMLEAELLRRRQSVAQLAAERDASLVVLGDLTGREITSAAVLSSPDLAAEVTNARTSFDSLRARPEYEQFARTRDVLRVQQESADAQARPRVSAFGRTGYGRPGLDPFASGFNSYWLAGVQLDWSPWSWGTTDRNREVLVLQEEVVNSEEAAFTASLRRTIARDIATMDRLGPVLAADDTIIALREQVLREARLRYAEGVITSAELVDRETDLLAARLALASHRTELAQARTRFLTTLGLPIR